ncbi:Spy/CpxP family protein refolding chaperone [Pseudorhodoplanes sp.]|uniref:Spy/CpxP family protein refolding chaperone n=1 Tax=Pseudorhodoplanes sp. TaxID=1934341 RepID=UPI00391C8B99
MWKALGAGLLALALISVTATSRPAFAEPSARMEAGIARLKAALRLTPEQEKHWPRVEAALRAIVSEGDRQQVADASGQTGFFSGVGARATELAVSAAALRRLASAARPLVNSLDDEQKREAVSLARAMGFGRLAARLM